MAILVLEKRLQSQQHKVSLHKRYLVSWFSEHVILITTGFITGFLCLAYAGWKAGELKFSPKIMMQISQLFVVYLAQYLSFRKEKLN